MVCDVLIAATMITIVGQLLLKYLLLHLVVARSSPNICQEDAKRSHSINFSINRNGNGHRSQHVGLLDFLRNNE